MQDRYDAGQVEYMTGGIQVSWDAEQVGCRTGGIQDRWDAGQVEYRTGEMQDSWNAGLDRCRVFMREAQDRSRVVKPEPPFLAGASAREKAAPALTFGNI